MAVNSRIALSPAARDSNLGCVCVGLCGGRGLRLYAYLLAPSARRLAPAPTAHLASVRIQERPCGKATEASLQATEASLQATEASPQATEASLKVAPRTPLGGTMGVPRDRRRDPEARMHGIYNGFEGSPRSANA